MVKSIFGNNKFRSYAAKLCAPMALLIVIGLVVTFGRPADSSAQSLEKLNRFVQSAKASDAPTQMFAQGRDLLQEREYGKAAERFQRFVNDYPRHKDIDAALYWLAYSLTKTERFAEADRQIERLFREHPKSNWADDARSLRVQIAGQVRDTRTITNELDNDNAEIKSIALQSMFQADPERASVIVADMLKPDSKANWRLKEAAVMLMAQHGGAKSTDTLLALARGGGDPKLQKTAIFWLSQSNDKRAFELLLELAGSNNVEVARAALLPLAQHNDERAKQALLNAARNNQSTELRREAIFWLGQFGGDNVVDELLKIYADDKDTEVRKHVLFVLTQNKSPRAAEKLNEVARSGGDAELRKQAIFWIGQRGDEQSLQTLVQLYDSEKDDGIKDQLVFAFSQSHSKAALAKLMQIAKSDSSVEARKKAIFWLGQSKDPEARKFIEEILK
ncbi:MAG: HEAT repeat domain-containing protein [Acidobacteriota bacterium]